MSEVPIVCDGFVIFKCTACEGRGTILVIPDGMPPARHDKCRACKGIGLVRIPIAELATFPEVSAGNPVESYTPMTSAGKDITVKELCEQIGYGFVMESASRQWLKKDPAAFLVGPCESETRKCECRKPNECDWCCGTGWLTKKVKELKDSMEPPQ